MKLIEMDWIGMGGRKGKEICLRDVENKPRLEGRIKLGRKKEVDSSGMSPPS